MTRVPGGTAAGVLDSGVRPLPEQRRATGSAAERWRAALLTAALVVVAAAAVAVTGAGATTAGAGDQRGAHLPTILRLAHELPRVDITSIEVATGPLFHLLVAVPVRVLDLGPVGAQIAGSLLAAGCAALVLLAAPGSVHATRTRLLIAAPLLLSPYFWQSALWLNTDDTAVLFGLGALLLALHDRRTRTCAVVGGLLACAVATRQTWVWLVPPAAAAVLQPWAPPGRASARLALVCGPPLAVLVILLVSWRGLTPPAFQNANDTPPSAVSISYCFALLAFFLVPVAWSAAPPGARWFTTPGLVVGAVAALPALALPSAATVGSDARTGGWLWEVVRLTPAPHDRSLLLALLAVVGGLTLVRLLRLLRPREAWAVSSGVAALAITLTPGINLFQRYTEVPLLLLAFLVTLALVRRHAVRRYWPLVLVAVAQAAVLCVVVVAPVVGG